MIAAAATLLPRSRLLSPLIPSAHFSNRLILWGLVYVVVPTSGQAALGWML